MALLRFELPASLRGSIRMLLIGIFILSDCGLALSSCPGLRKLSNGRLFFRYGGIYVTFFCHPGFKRYGFPTSSCVSGRWTRAPPVCVAPGCPDVGNILHGSRTVLAGSSVVQFRCDSGFGLQGSPVLYCDGNNWNDTKPMCKVTQRAPYSAPITSKPHGWFQRVGSYIIEESSARSGREFIKATRRDPQNKEILLKYDSKQPRVSDEVAQIVTRDAVGSKPALSLTDDVRNSFPFPSSEIAQGDRIKYTSTAIKAAKPSPSAASSILQFKEMDPNVITELSSSTNSVPSPPVSGTVLPTASRNYANLSLPTPNDWHKSVTTTTVAMPQSPEFPTSQTSAHVDVSTTKDVSSTTLPGPVSHNQMDVQTKEELMSTDQILPPLDAIDQEQTIKRSNNIQFANLLRATPMDLDQAKSITPESTAANGRASSSEDPLASINGVIVQTWANQITPTANRLNKVTDGPSDAHSPKLTETELQNELVEISVVDETHAAQIHLQRPIVCPSPPVPNQGILYFHNLVRPSPWQYTYYVQYACIPGYSLAHGDQFSFCQHNGSWSGERPVCADVNECTIGLNPCHQICTNTFGSYKCSCQSGFLLAQDGKTCTDINECLDLHSRQQQCEWRCLNLPGSFHCICPRGYTSNGDKYLCEDINECSYNNGGCSQLCINTSGGYRCACPEGYIFSLHSKKNCQIVQI